LEQPKLLKLMGVAARKRVEENFNVVANARKTAGLLKRVAFSSGYDQKAGNNYKLSQPVNGNGSVKIAT
jgi:hypothetical protein